MNIKTRKTPSFTTKKLLYLYLILIALYIILNLFLPVDPETLAKYRLTATQAKLVQLTIFIPIALIWLVAVYGYGKLRAYTATIKNNKDGKQIAKVSNGLLISTIGLPVTSIVTTILNHITQRQPNFMPTSTIINHYLSLGFALATFLIISTGTRGLADTVKGRPTQKTILILVFIFAMVSSLYCYVAFSDPARHQVVTGTQHATYYLPDWLLLTTIVAPYLFVWFIGMVSALETYYYKKRVSGIIYKKSFAYVAYGLALIIISSITIQFLASLNTFFSDLSFKSILAIIYVFLIIYAAGYVFIAVGANRLKKIEEV